MAGADRTAQFAATLSLQGAQVFVVLRGGARIHAEVVGRRGHDVFEVAPWGGTRPITIAIGDVVVAGASEIDSVAEYRRICERQRRELEGEGGADA
jgi:hypothetical protein